MGLKQKIAGKIQQIGRRRLVFAALSLAITSIVVTGFLIENRWGYSKPAPLLVFMENWSLKRSAADVEADRAREKAEKARASKATPEELAALYKAQADARAKLAEESASKALDTDEPAPKPAPTSAPAPAPAPAKSKKPA